MKLLRLLALIALMSGGEALSTGQAEAQFIAPGHVLGNGTASSRTATDTPLPNVLDQYFGTNGFIYRSGALSYSIVGSGIGLAVSGGSLNLQPSKASVIGGVESLTCGLHQWLNQISTAGIPSCTQPGFADLAGSATLAQLPSIGSETVMGNAGGSAAPPAALSQAQLTALINPFSATLVGAVPASGGGTTNFLRADGTWQPPSGGGGNHGSCYVDGIQYSTLAAALAACTGNVNIIVAMNQTISSPLGTYAGSNVKISCINGATLTYAAGTGLAVTGNNVDEGEGCNFVGPGKATVSNGSLFLNTGSFDKFHDATVTGWGAVGATNSDGAIVQWGPGFNYGEAYGNNFPGDGDVSVGALFGSTNPMGFSVHDNPHLEGLLVIAASHSFKLFNPQIHDNGLVAGNWAGQQGICLFLADTNGGNEHHNPCILAGNIQSGVGGIYSFADNVGLSSDGDHLTIGSFDIGATNDYTFEYNGCLACRIGNNYGETNTGTAGFVGEDNEFTTYTGNVEHGCGNSTNNGCFVWSDTGQAGYNMVGVTSSNNVAIYSAAENLGVGYQIQIATGQSGNTFKSLGDTFIGGASATFGFNVALNGTGAFDNLEIATPQIATGVAVGYSVASGVTHFTYIPGGNQATSAGAGPTSTPR